MLRELGVVEIFHKVSLKPGKPLWFGVLDRGERRTLVFGLPGNPVSTFVCFRLFVTLAIVCLKTDIARFEPNPGFTNITVPARLGADFFHRGDRPTYHPAHSEQSDDAETIVVPLAWKGSGDLRTLLDADGLIVFPPGDKQYAKGDSVGYLPL